MDGDARPPSNRTMAQEASNIHGHKNAKLKKTTKDEHLVKQVRLNEIQKSKRKTHFTALKDNRNTQLKEK